MKKNLLTLTVLIVAGVLLALVVRHFILSTPAEVPNTANPIVDMENPSMSGTSQWVLSAVSAQGAQYMYPQTLTTQFISAQNWPPQVTVPAGDFSCAEGQHADTDGVMKKFEKHMIGDRTYCVAIESEGAAGSTYTTYNYSTQQGDFVPHVSFTLRFPQCLNYDQPNQSQCLAEQKTFDIDGLADRIISSIRMK